MKQIIQEVYFEDFIAELREIGFTLEEKRKGRFFYVVGKEPQNRFLKWLFKRGMYKNYGVISRKNKENDWKIYLDLCTISNFEELCNLIFTISKYNIAEDVLLDFA